MDKLLIALIASIFTLLIKHFYDLYVKKEKIKKMKNGVDNFIEFNVIGTLEHMKEQYKSVINEIISPDCILKSISTTEYPWLNSKMFDVFIKDDLVEVLIRKDKDFKTFVLFFRVLNELDFLQQNNPRKLLKEFEGTLKTHFAKEDIKDVKEQIKHFKICLTLQKEIKFHVSSMENRILHINKLVEQFNKIRERI